MSRTLIICEKPSVASDVAKALFGRAAKKAADHWESPDAIVAWAVGHLVEQVDPDAYDAQYKKWRYEDLPIVPEQFRYHARDARAKKQLSVLHRLMGRADVELIVNACDAGREGELIFKLILETAPKKVRSTPVKRAWFSSMTPKAIKDAFDNLRSAEQLRPLGAAARRSRTASSRSRSTRRGWAGGGPTGWWG